MGRFQIWARGCYKTIFKFVICFILTIIFISGCSGHNSKKNKYGNFIKAVKLNQIRYYHSATLLPNGNVLIAGGVPNNQFGMLDSAELYLTKKNKFVMTGKMNVARDMQASVRLKNGMALLFGGFAKGPIGSLHGTDAVEEYNYKTGKFKIVGHLLERRTAPQAVLLNNGKVFVYGGAYPKAGYAEIYDPVTNRSKYTSLLNLSRSNFALAKLKDGKVLIIGGAISFLCDGKLEKKIGKMPLIKRIKYVLSAELYNPRTDTFKLILGLNKFRNGNGAGGPSAVTLPTGKVLIAGGNDYNYKTRKMNEVSEVELYDPKTNKFSIIGRINHISVTPRLNLIDHKYVLISDGSKEFPSYLFDIRNRKFFQTGKMIENRGRYTATNISPNKVLIVGGVYYTSKRPKTSEIFIYNAK